jgi:hypothetical protein
MGKKSQQEPDLKFSDKPQQHKNSRLRNTDFKILMLRSIYLQAQFASQVSSSRSAGPAASAAGRQSSAGGRETSSSRAPGLTSTTNPRCHTQPGGPDSHLPFGSSTSLSSGSKSLFLFGRWILKRFLKSSSVVTDFGF